MRVTKIAAVVAILTGLIVAGTAALAGAAAPAGGPIKLFVTNVSNTKGKIVITGAIGDYGTTLSVNKNGKVNPNGAYEKVSLKKGSFVVNGTALNKKLDHSKPAVNKATCSLSFRGTGPTTLYDGTGAYKGIGGKVKITVTYAGIGPRYTSGAKAGQCNLSNKAKPLAQYQSISGSGSVHFG